MHLSLATAIGTISAVFGFLMGAYQLHRAYKVGIDGISLATWCSFGYLAVWWSAYGFAINSPESAWGNIATIPVIFLVVRKLDWKNGIRTLYINLLVVVLIPGLMTAIGGWSVGVVGVGAIALWNRFPQILKCIRYKDVEGVSASGWLIGTICSMFWTYYFYLVHQWYTFYMNICLTTASLTIVVLSLWRQLQWKKDQLAVIRGH